MLFNFELKQVILAMRQQLNAMAGMEQWNMIFDKKTSSSQSHITNKKNQKS